MPSPRRDFECTVRSSVWQSCRPPKGGSKGLACRKGLALPDRRSHKSDGERFCKDCSQITVLFSKFGNKQSWPGCPKISVHHSEQVQRAGGYSDADKVTAHCNRALLIHWHSDCDAVGAHRLFYYDVDLPECRYRDRRPAPDHAPRRCSASPHCSPASSCGPPSARNRAVIDDPTGWETDPWRSLMTPLPGEQVEVLYDENGVVRALPFLCSWMPHRGWILSGTHRKVPVPILGWRSRSVSIYAR